MARRPVLRSCDRVVDTGASRAENGQRCRPQRRPLFTHSFLERRPRGKCMKCPQCAEDMELGVIAVQGTFWGFLAAGVVHPALLLTAVWRLRSRRQDRAVG